MKLELINCLIVLILLLAIAGSSSGARGGGRFSGGRYSSRYSGSRSSGRYGSSRGSGYSTMSLLVSKRFSYRVNRRAYTSGIFFSSWHWRRRHSDYSDSATLCFNVIDDLPAEHNSSVVEPWLYRNRTVYGLFVCPIEPGREDQVYCCGEEDGQRCCSFWRTAAESSDSALAWCWAAASASTSLTDATRATKGTRTANRKAPQYPWRTPIRRYKCQTFK
ncbi:hypothetical protein BOX15_Mlig028763g1 [Macrostomum lignano]|uniref:CX domain-containing protein n=1 Tax=Macrostomum lignano TaxID=282301 RepID=A0A267GSC3_9PLAT|nr:hypothetical protein BOX15_Mlig028763g1 [Macrostomum lignano]